CYRAVGTGDLLMNRTAQSVYFPVLLFFIILQRSRIQVWLYEQVNMRIEGCIIGFDEYMNLVLDDAEEIHSKTKSRKQLGRIMLKGDNITLLQSVSN
ncbi:RUXE protein, partial [Thinocorus orbignyianus]|nr:RUXE protein [Thinocorus orbignyianus]